MKLKYFVFLLAGLLISCNSRQESADTDNSISKAVDLVNNDFTEVFENTPRSTRADIRIVLNDSLGNKAELPIIVVKGAKEGTVFTWLSGVHGAEYASIIATQELLKEIEPTQLSGTLIVIPIANEGAFYGREPYVNPLDGKNLNNAFPGNSEGTVTDQIAHYITQNIIPVTDVFLDIHGGDAPEDLLPFVCYYVDENQPEQTALAKRLSDNSGFDYSVAYPFNINYEQPAKYAFKQAVQDGKTGVSIECGRLGLVEQEAVALIKKGVYNMIGELNMYGSSLGPSEKLLKLGGQIYIDTKVAGIFYSDLKAGDEVKAGDIVGYTTDAFGKTLEEYKTPEDGIVLYMLATPPINIYDTVMCISTGIEKNE